MSKYRITTTEMIHSTVVYEIDAESLESAFQEIKRNGADYLSCSPTGIGEDTMLSLDEVFEILPDGSAVSDAALVAEMEKINTIIDEDEEEKCSKCGADLDDGEGWDGLCGNCADRAARKEQQ